MTQTTFKNAIVSALGSDCTALTEDLGELCAVVPADLIAEIMLRLRDDSNVALVQLMDVCGADYPQREPRFDVVYNLLSLHHNQRLRLKVQVKDGESVPTVTGVYSSAGWFERETWDMYGIPFSGHPDLRRILTDYGFEGHPLRKDFPLIGRTQVRYDEDTQSIVHEPARTDQEYRDFDFMSPWAGSQTIQK